MEKYVIFLNGAYPSDDKRLIDLCKGRTIIACDGGLNKVFKLGLKPSKIVGDFDSVDKNILEKYMNTDVEIISLIKEKDYTDFEVSLLSFVPNQKGRFNKKDIEDNSFKHLENKDILVLGATGGRIDMTLSNLKKLHNIPSMYFITEKFETIKCIKKTTKLNNLKGRTFSIIPITDITNMSLYGFKYLLANNNISKDIGLASNIVIEDELVIEFDNGLMYLIYD